MAKIPSWIRPARENWTYHGQTRPPFAVPPEAGQESVWDYPRPPRIESDSREVVVSRNGIEIARTNRALRVLETASPPTYYLPPLDVRVDYLAEASGDSICEWKGLARYWSVALPDQRLLQNAAWSYEDPFEGCEQIAGYFSFYASLLECYVDGTRVKPQPGTIYGGWVTHEVVGPFKGESGSENW
ncbi:hypothetical protein CA54_27230 [Symmachiella macrocystis]|uniref:DUF427 domain-containing protein n=1 Tax=Symmachiella macrocystis TaxID=2527985 RepID=A0A5C6BQB3_9PLAN|nr:DUF427 domain-containing protein [Symmachiella macrocystis]TWU13882.1 hypothetical protein CA54_27230 [Symmachiella macrocystis]